MLPVARRALSAVAVVLGVVTLTFFLLRLAPGDPARLLVGPAATADQVAAQRRAWDSTARCRSSTPCGWPTSRAATGAPAWPPGARSAPCWARRGPPPCCWSESASSLSYLAGIAIGVIQALRGGRLDTALSVVTVTLFALPGYWLGLMLVMLFTYRLRMAAGVRLPPASTPTCSPGGTAWPTGCATWPSRSPPSP